MSHHELAARVTNRTNHAIEWRENAMTRSHYLNVTARVSAAILPASTTTAIEP